MGKPANIFLPQGILFSQSLLEILCTAAKGFESGFS
jgi:hypothetical protein